MRLNCISCGYEINLDHRVFDNYQGPVKCFCCNTMMGIKTVHGLAYSVNPAAHIERTYITEKFERTAVP